MRSPGSAALACPAISGAAARPALVFNKARREKDDVSCFMSNPRFDERSRRTDTLFLAAFIHPGIDAAGAADVDAGALNRREILRMGGEIDTARGVIGRDSLTAQFGRPRRQILQIGFIGGGQALFGEGPAVAPQVPHQ